MASTINGTSTGNGGLVTSGDDSGILQLQTNETTAVTIDASQDVTVANDLFVTGNVGIGTSSPLSRLHINGASSSAPTSGTTPTGVFQLTTNSAGYSLYGGGQATGSFATWLQCQNKNDLSDFGPLALQPVGGNLLVGTTTVNGTEILQIKAGGVQWSTGPNTTNGNFDVLNASGTGVYLANGGTSWIGLSDETTKDIIEPIENAAEKVTTLRAVIGKYKTDEEGVRRSFLIAQDVQTVLPEAVNENHDGKLGLSYTDVIPLLVAAIKEQQALITSLTERITALEGATQ